MFCSQRKWNDGRMLWFVVTLMDQVFEIKVLKGRK
jgi:hypothetical protein